MRSFGTWLRPACLTSRLLLHLSLQNHMDLDLAAHWAGLDTDGVGMVVTPGHGMMPPPLQCASSRGWSRLGELTQADCAAELTFVVWYRFPAVPSSKVGEDAPANWRYWYGAPLATKEEQQKHAEFLEKQDKLMREEMAKLGDQWPAASWARFGAYCWGYGRPFLSEEEAKKHEELMKKHEVCLLRLF